MSVQKSNKQHVPKQFIAAFLSAPFRFYPVETNASEKSNITLTVKGINTLLNKRILSGNQDT